MMIDQQANSSANNGDAVHDTNDVMADLHQAGSVGSAGTQGGAHPASANGSDPLTFMDFFAGAELVRLGLEPSWSCTWANDIDPRKREVYEAHFGTGKFVLGDVGAIEANSLPVGADMAWASFPCQNLSLAGWRRGMRAERSGTFWEFWRLMRDSLDYGERPPLIVIENVVGMLYGNDFSALCEALAALGMQFGPLVVDARLFLPQSRPRVFVVAVDSRIDFSLFVNEQVPDAAPWFTKAVMSAHKHIPASLQNSWRWWSLPEPSFTVLATDDMIEEDPTGVQWHEPEETVRLLEMMTTVNLEKTNRAIERGPSVGFLYKRIRGGVQRAEVRFDGVAGCLRTPQGGSSRQIVLILKDGNIRSRLLSPREAARLMGVPDLFWLPPRYNDAYRAIGDGVAVPVVRWLSDRLLTHLARLCRDSQFDIRGKGDGAARREWMVHRRHVEKLVMSRKVVAT